MMNTGDSDTNKTTIFLEYMNEIYVDRDFYGLKSKKAHVFQPLDEFG